MRRAPHSTLRFGAALAAAILLAPAARAQADLPRAQAIVDRYVEAIGGKAALDRVQGFRARGTFAMPAAGVTAQMEIAQARPDRMAMTITMPGMGTITTGYDGTHGWSVNPMQGPRLLEGKELQALRDQAQFDLGRASANVASRETIEKTEMGGKPCYKVKTVYKSGRELFECYSTETGLLIGFTATQDSPMGAIEATTLVGNYKEFGGIKLPTETRIQAMGQEQVLTMDSIEVGPVPEAMFRMPPEIEALVKQKAGGSR